MVEVVATVVPSAASGRPNRPARTWTSRWVKRLKMDTGIGNSIFPHNRPAGNSDNQSFSSPMTRTSGSNPLPRASGVQLHPTSLPGGRLGEEAFAFVDWLAEAGQTWWQTLPLGPVGEGGSPYKSPSAFAGSPQLLADPDAPVSAAELDALREREGYWLLGWEDFAGPDAGADQVRFDREWTELRTYAGERG